VFCTDEGKILDRIPAEIFAKVEVTAVGPAVGAMGAVVGLEATTMTHAKSRRI